MTERTKPYNQASYRHVLVDMHIPDWSPEFLRLYEPKQIADCISSAGVGAAMVYFQSHVGLCNWPTESGKQHSAFAGRDPMASILEQLHGHGIPVCAYYSVNFNNWAYLEHPEWRLVPAVASAFGGGLLPAERYGLCCLNNPGYRNFIDKQSAEIVGAYEIDAMFFDMVWWQSICVCDHCRARCKKELGIDIPVVIDWLDADWCAFQSARERWLIEFATDLRAGVRKLQPAISVYHNFAVALGNWTKGVSFESATAHDFLGGDFYGGRDEQLVISKLMLNLSESLPTQFMTTIPANLAEHEGLKSVEELRIQALAATACASSFLMIAPINPDGTPHAEIFRRIGEVYSETKKYEPYLGGQPVEDVGVYFSSESKINFIENGSLLTEAPTKTVMQYPHLEAVRGACSKLQGEHLPFGVITRKQLSALAKYKVIVLPNVLRMDAEEMAAFRTYVREGGKIYASRLTSLTEGGGVRHEDFMLSDVFGCSFEHVEDGRVVYVRPETGKMADALAGQTYVSHWLSACDLTGSVRLRSEVQGEVLAKLSLPFGYPHGGSVDDHNWASIHSYPPGDNLEAPTIVEHSFGLGTAIYSAADIEAGTSGAHSELFVHLIRSLLGNSPSFTAETHPAVWMTVFDQVEKKRMIVSFLNFQTDLPIIPLAEVPFQLRKPKKMSFKRLLSLPDETELSFDVATDGTVSGKIRDLETFQMLAAEYE